MRSNVDPCERGKLVQAMENELELLMTLNHPHILPYVHHIRKGPSLHIFTEYCDAGDLSTMMESLKK